jgi:hypothetical protein
VSRCCEDGRANWRQGRAGGVPVLADQHRQQPDVRLRARMKLVGGDSGRAEYESLIVQGVAGALGASPRIDRAVPVSARTSTCVMAILEISPSRISVRAHVRARTRRLLGPSGRRSHPTGRRRPARSQCAEPGRRAAVIIDLAQKPRAGGRAEIRLRRATLRVSLPHACRVMRRQPRWAPLAQMRLAVWLGRMNLAVPRIQGSV